MGTRLSNHLHIPGAVILKKGAFVFRCPVCGNTVRADDAYEPMCTGPSWTDDHEPTLMILK